MNKQADRIKVSFMISFANKIIICMKTPEDRKMCFCVRQLQLSSSLTSFQRHTTNCFWFHYHHYYDNSHVIFLYVVVHIVASHFFVCLFSLSLTLMKNKELTSLFLDDIHIKHLRTVSLMRCFMPFSLPFFSEKLLSLKTEEQKCNAIMAIITQLDFFSISKNVKGYKKAVICGWRISFIQICI